MKLISSFTGKYSFLSNFHPVQVRYEGLTYKTAEHAFQAAKTLDPKLRRQIRGMSTPGQAKSLGRRVELRPFWDEIRLQAMEQILRSKFENPIMRDLLLDTCPAILIEGNNWYDTYWGVTDWGRGEGMNHLGRLLMKIRKELMDDGD